MFIEYTNIRGRNFAGGKDEYVCCARAAQLAEDRSELFGAVDPLLKAREAVEQQILDLDRSSGATVHDGSWHRPGHGPLLPCDDR